MRNVEITGWVVGAQKVSHTKLIQSATGLGLVAAKDVTDAVLSGKRPVVQVESEDAAHDLIERLASIGFQARLEAQLAYGGAALVEAAI